MLIQAVARNGNTVIAESDGAALKFFSADIRYVEAEDRPLLTGRSTVVGSWMDRAADAGQPSSGRFSLWTDRRAAGGGPANRLGRHASLGMSNREQRRSEAGSYPKVGDALSLCFRRSSFASVIHSSRGE